MKTGLILKWVAKAILVSIVNPFLVLILASYAVDFAIKHTFNLSHLDGHTGFKLNMWIAILWFTLTLIYYLFCIFQYAFHRSKWRHLITLIFVIVPVVLYAMNSIYDYRVTVCFALFHVTYYLLFIIERHILGLLTCIHKTK